LDTVAEFDDEVTNKYLGGETLTVEEIQRAIRKGTLAFKIVPVMCGSAFKNKGIQQLLDAVLDYLPSPMDIAPKIGVDPAHGNKEVIRKPSDDEPFSAIAFKIMTDPFVGTLTYVRVYSGVLEKGASIFNAAKGKQERVGRLLLMHANKREEIEKCETGNICAVVGMRLTTTGDTLCDPKHPVLLEKMSFPEPVISVAIEPKTKGDQDKLDTSVQKLQFEDPTFRMHTDDDTGQVLISGMGELHLEIIVDRLLREFKVEANVGKPQVAYRETITKEIEQEGKYERRQVAPALFAGVTLRLTPAEEGTGFSFENKVSGSKMPKEFEPAVKKGVEGALSAGIQAGYPVVDIKVQLVDVVHNDTESTELAYTVAAAMAFREGCKRAQAVLLEPVMKVEVVTPEDFMGGVVGDLSSRRGKITGMNQRLGAQVIDAEVPLNQMFGYATAVRSLSQGRASYSMQFDHYEKVPNVIADQIIQKLGGG